MPDPVLTLLKYVFLAILYLFFLRVLRAVWIELRELLLRLEAAASRTQPSTRTSILQSPYLPAPSSRV